MVRGYKAVGLYGEGFKVGSHAEIGARERLGGRGFRLVLTGVDGG
jgi:hypothetical protein